VSSEGQLTTFDEWMMLMPTLAKIGRNDVAYRLIHNDTFPSWRLSPSNTAPPASGNVGTAGRPKPALAIPAHETGKQGQEDLRARTFQNLLALEFSVHGGIPGKAARIFRKK
jgi:hypothetical protein